MSLLDQTTSVVNGECETRGEHASLQTTIKKLLNRQTENVVQLLLGLGQETETSQTTKEGSTFEKTLRILATRGEEGRKEEGRRRMKGGRGRLKNR